MTTQAASRPTHGSAATRREHRVARLRLLACAGTVVATVPYLSLKARWLTGSTVGVTDTDFIHDPSVTVLNAVTAGMDALAILVAVALVSSWGARLPAWSVLLPAWVATGLLAPIAVVSVLALPLASGEGDAGGLPLEAWVRPMVYGGFTLQGVGLIAGFAFYAAARWGTLLRGTLRVPARTLSRQMHSQVGTGAAAGALVLGGLTLAWAWGLSWGLPDEMVSGRSAADVVASSGHGLFAVATSVGVLALVHGYPRSRPFWMPAVLAWVGSAAMFSWGLWGLVNVLASTALTSTSGELAASHLHTLSQTLVGLVAGLVSLSAVIERADEDGTAAARPADVTGR